MAWTVVWRYDVVSDGGMSGGVGANVGIGAGVVSLYPNQIILYVTIVTYSIICGFQYLDEVYESYETAETAETDEKML